MSPCGSCGGRAARPGSQYVVTLAGVAQPEKHDSPQAARIWIAQNANGQAATIKAVPKL